MKISGIPIAAVVFALMQVVASISSSIPSVSPSSWGISAPTKEEKASVDAATRKWIEAVTGPGDTSQEVTDLYAEDAVFWGSVSEEVRVGRMDIKNYYEYFADIPGLRVRPGSFRSVVQVFGDIAMSSGHYEYQFPREDGKLNSIPVRFTFAYRRGGANGSWEIVNHHGSKLPAQPAAIKPVSSSVPNALRLAVEILKNIIEHPFEAKYRMVNLAGVAGTELVRSHDVMAFLKNCGFKEEGASLVFPATGSLPALVTALQTLQASVIQ